MKGYSLNPAFKTLSKTKNVYHLSAVRLVLNLDENDAPEVRHINVVIETKDGTINRKHIEHIQRSAVDRMCAEHGIQPNDVKDLTIMNISTLGQMTKEDFLGEPKVANSAPV